MRWLVRREWLPVAGVLLVMTALALPILTYPPGRDQGEFATIARGILDGHAPYTHLWNPKPPAVFYIYALAMSVLGRTAPALRAIDLVVIPATAAALYLIGRRVANRRTALWTLVVFPAFYFTETFWTLTQNDGIAMLPMALAMLAMLRAAEGAGRRSGWKWALAAGMLSAITLWFKYPFIFFVGALAAGYAIKRRHAGRGIVGREAAAFAAGGITIMAAGALYLAAIGALEALIESARVTAGYTRLTYNTADLIDLMRTSLGFRREQWGLLLALVALWPFLRRVSSTTRGAHSEAGGHAGWAPVGLWLLAGLLIVLVQARGYDYHWLPLLPPLALLAADALDRAAALLARGAARFAPPGAARAAVHIALGGGLLLYMAGSVWPAALPYLAGRQSQLEYYGGFQAGEFVADESLEVVNFLRERVAPGDSLYIWGFRPEVYYLAGLNPATRFIFHFPLVGPWYPREWQQQNVDTLWAALPPYVLVMQADYLPFVTGSDEDSHTLLQDYTELNNWLAFNYERETQIGNFLIWRRKPSPT